MSTLNAKFLSEFSVVQEPYTYIQLGEVREVPLIRKNSNKKFAMLVRVKTTFPHIFHQCVIYDCDLSKLASCVGCRCLAGSRKDKKAATFEILYIYQID